MSTVTAAQAHTILHTALIERADKCRKFAARRTMAGQPNVRARAALRLEAQHCEALAKRLDRLILAELAELLNLPVGAL